VWSQVPCHTSHSLFFKRRGDENGGHVFGGQLFGVPPVGRGEGIVHGRVKVDRDARGQLHLQQHHHIPQAIQGCPLIMTHLHNDNSLCVDCDE